MDFHPISRSPDAFQQPASATTIMAMSERAFGRQAVVRSAQELRGGLYNTTYLVELAHKDDVILRIAPDFGRQSRLERLLMRNEHAALPFFAPIAAMMPQTLFADWTHDVISRDYIWQTKIQGRPGVEAIKTYPRAKWAFLYRQLGAITAKVHAVRGQSFGPVAGPHFGKWSEAIAHVLSNASEDMDDHGLNSSDVQWVRRTILARSDILDEVEEPRLLHGDLWTPNILLSEDAPEPTVVGVLDHDRSWWGDPAAEWGLSLITTKPPGAQAAFWDGYGHLEITPHAKWRAAVYRAIHIAAIRLERNRVGNHAGLADSYKQMTPVLHVLLDNGRTLRRRNDRTTH